MNASLADVGRVLMVGCGNMGGAMLTRWIDAGLSPDKVTVLTPSGRAVPDGVQMVREFRGGSSTGTATFDTVILAMKPQQLAQVHARDLGLLAPKLLISILAGVEVGTLARLWPNATIVRAMPNLPVAIGKGVVGLHTVAASAEVRAVTDTLMTPLGLCEWIDDEGLFDVLTALAGSGPAFLFRFIDALGAAGIELGLSPDQASRLALATVAGSAIMASAAHEAPGELANKVASKGGSTGEGLDVLDRDHALVELLRRTLDAATRRNREMAAAARG
ncbi:pyrroline-5-carboxylate reductase family protein [Sphingomonas aerophila]|uniref:Pyrroline-5-carboxylate reductase n=1 Tax=Sphingomonas aerophila TaxID=1344948 RepID=A0A7W9BFR1_9SPHN|nr:pyrroline-5-carboxylate reductase [Sphingomonas aerophila]MBB5716036.1 pyrroline-5-carboxylate reductase [Sphingomonas aerophila]